MKWKKQIIYMTGIILLLLGNIRLPVQAEEAPEEPEDLYARSAVLLDADSGRVLFGKEEHVIRPMASTTKIMTCILALEEMEEGQTATASQNAARQPKVRLGVQEGEEYYLKDLLYALMLESYNDSAVVIAEEISGSVENFADQMNEKAAALGCTDTHFVTPNGLDGEDEEGIHSTTAKDLARIMRYCIMESPKREAFLEVTRTKQYSFTDVEGKRSFSCSNHNALLDMMDGALSGKTGFTADAGYCYVGALRQGERTFIVALLACGWPNNKNYKWADTRKLMEYGLNNYEYHKIEPETDVLEIPVEKGVDDKDPYQKTTTVRAAVKESEPLSLLMRGDEKIEKKTELPKTLAAPVKKGQKVGEMICLLEGEEVGRFEIWALEDVRRYDFGTAFHSAARKLLL